VGWEATEANARAQEDREKEERNTENCNAVPSPMSKRAVLKYLGISYEKPRVGIGAGDGCEG
jgi:hypothetical protein